VIELLYINNDCFSLKILHIFFRVVNLHLKELFLIGIFDE
jgi:hypothetical protein